METEKDIMDGDYLKVSLTRTSAGGQVDLKVHGLTIFEVLGLIEMAKIRYSEKYKQELRQ